MRKLRIIPILVSAGLALSACGSSNDAGKSSPTTNSQGSVPPASLVTAAQSEGAVTLYTDWGPTQFQPAVDAFQKKYNMKVTVVRDVIANLGPKIDLELQSGQGIADAIVFSTPEAFEKYGKANDLVKPSGPAFEGKTSYDVEKYVDPYNSFQVGGVVGTFVWNTDLQRTAINEWNDFLKPTLSNGKIGVQPPDTENNAEWWISAEKAAGSGWIEKLAAQRPHVYASAVPMNQAIVSGEVLATPRGFPTLVNAAKAQGAPITFIKTPDAVAGTRHRGAVLRTSKHQNAAWLFFDFVLSEEGQQLINRDGTSVLPGVGVAQNADLPPPLSLTPEQLAAYQAKWNKLFVRS